MIDPASLSVNARRALQQPASAPQRPPEAVKTPIHDNPPDRPLPHAQPQRDETPALGQTVAGKEKVLGRVRVRFTGYRVRPLDPDNFAGSCKDSLDFLRHARLIEGDEPWRIILETEQVKVATFKEERTEITVTTP